MEFADTLSLWWIYPVSVLIATVALSTGISGALFFAPFFLLVVGLTPAQAIGAGLMTELFGTGFGAFNYLRQRCVVVWSIPGVVTGAQIGPRIQGRVPTDIADRGLAGVFMAVGALVILVRTTA